MLHDDVINYLVANCVVCLIEHKCRVKVNIDVLGISRRTFYYHVSKIPRVEELIENIDKVIEEYNKTKCPIIAMRLPIKTSKGRSREVILVRIGFNEVITVLNILKKLRETIDLEIERTVKKVKRKYIHKFSEVLLKSLFGDTQI